jgi:hypothetical protein
MMIVCIGAVWVSRLCFLLWRCSHGCTSHSVTFLVLNRSAVNPNPEPDWSGAHKGLAVYISRLLAPIWEAKLITPSSRDANVWKARLSDGSMTVRDWRCKCRRTVFRFALAAVLSTAALCDRSSNEQDRCCIVESVCVAGPPVFG